MYAEGCRGQARNSTLAMGEERSRGKGLRAFCLCRSTGRKPALAELKYPPLACSFRLLQDQVEAIRQLTAQTVSPLVAPEHPCNHTVALRLSFAHLLAAFPPEQALICLVNEVRQSCTVQQFEFSQETKKRVFFTEPLNCFQEPKLISHLALSQIQQIFQHCPALKTSTAWLDLLALVADLSTQSLSEEEAYQVAFVQAQIAALV